MLTDLGAAVVRLAVAALLSASSASLTGSEGVKATIGESSMRNPLVRAPMATAAVEAGDGAVSGRWSLVVEGGRHLCGILADALVKNTLQSAAYKDGRGETFVVARRRRRQRQQR